VSHDDAFLQAILESPDDDTSRLVYADYLDEHGGPDRAEFLRVQGLLARPRRDRKLIHNRPSASYTAGNLHAIRLAAEVSP